MYLKKKYNLTYGNFTASLVGNYLIVINTIFLIAFFCWYIVTHGSPQHSFSYIFLAIVLGSFLPMLFKLPDIKIKVFGLFNKLNDGWKILFKNKRIVIKLYLITIIINIYAGFNLYLSYLFINNSHFLNFFDFLKNQPTKHLWINNCTFRDYTR